MLTIGGMVLLDDLEAIDAPEPVFREYLDDVAVAVVRREGGQLFVGPTLHAMPDPAGTTRVHDDVATFSPPVEVTARVFGMNLAVLTEGHEVAARPDLAAGLDAIARGTRRASRRPGVCGSSRSAGPRDLPTYGVRPGPETVIAEPPVTTTGSVPMWWGPTDAPAAEARSVIDVSPLATRTWIRPGSGYEVGRSPP